MRMLRLTGLLGLLLVVAAPSVAFPPGSPDGSFSYSPGVPQPGQSVTFTISARDPDGTITRVTIEYGDGTKDSLPTPHTFVDDLAACAAGSTFSGRVTHQYASAGTYKAKLTVVGGSCPLTGPLQEDQTWTAKDIVVGRVPAASQGGSGDPGSSSSSF